MGSTKYILLIIGLLGSIAAIFMMIKTGSITDNLIGLICGACLIWGYFEISKKEVK